MNIAVIGLGIIGGSFCKAIKKYTDHFVIGINRTAQTAQRAFEVGAIDEIGTPQSLEKADLVILAMYPQADIDFIKENGKADVIITSDKTTQTSLERCFFITKSPYLLINAINLWFTDYTIRQYCLSESL